MPGDPTGMPGTARAVALGCSANRRLIALAGTSFALRPVVRANSWQVFIAESKF